VIYLDSSVMLAHLLAEDRIPPDSLWQQRLVSSRLLEYEVWNRVHIRRARQPRADVVRAALSRVAMIGLTPPVLARALEPFPMTVRTLDGLHLASIEFLASREKMELASFDKRLVAAARALDIPLFDLST
jgi:hypothetical protein